MPLRRPAGSALQLVAAASPMLTGPRPVASPPLWSQSRTGVPAATAPVAQSGDGRRSLLTQSMPPPLTAGKEAYRATLAREATAAIDANLAVGTDARYKHSVELYKAMCFETGNSETKQAFVPPTVPLMVLFIAHLMRRNLQAGTVQSHLSGLRSEATKLLCPDIYVNGRLPPVVAAAINGFVRMRELDPNYEAKAKLARLPVSPAMLLALLRQARLSLSPFLATRARLIYLLAFFGANRMGELLVAKAPFNPRIHLTERKVTIAQEGDVQFIVVHLSASKTDRAMKGVDVKCVNFPGEHSVTEAYMAYLAHRAMVPGVGADSAFFITELGVPLTTAKFRDELNLLCRAAGLPVGIMPHSFRSGAATTLVDMGATKEQTSLYGRWTSSAIDAYIKQTADARLKLASFLLTSLA